MAVETKQVPQPDAVTWGRPRRLRCIASNFFAKKMAPPGGGGAVTFPFVGRFLPTATKQGSEEWH